MSGTPSMIELAVRHMTGRPDAHLAVVESLVGDGFPGFRAEICDVEPCKSGPRKGKPNWRKQTNRETRYVTWEDFKAFEAEWSRTTGKCAKCMGSGEVFARWHVDEGTTMKPCPDCGGSGKADQ